MRVGTLAVGQILRQALVQLQAHTLPAFATATRNLRSQGEATTPDARQILVCHAHQCALAVSGASLEWLINQPLTST